MKLHEPSIQTFNPTEEAARRQHQDRVDQWMDHTNQENVHDLQQYIEARPVNTVSSPDFLTESIPYQELGYAELADAIINAQSQEDITKSGDMVDALAEKFATSNLSEDGILNSLIKISENQDETKRLDDDTLEEIAYEATRIRERKDIQKELDDAKEPESISDIKTQDNKPVEKGVSASEVSKNDENSTTSSDKTPPTDLNDSENPKPNTEDLDKIEAGLVEKYQEVQNRIKELAIKRNAEGLEADEWLEVEELKNELIDINKNILSLREELTKKDIADIEEHNNNQVKNLFETGNGASENNNSQDNTSESIDERFDKAIRQLGELAKKHKSEGLTEDEAGLIDKLTADLIDFEKNRIIESQGSVTKEELKQIEIKVVTTVSGWFNKEISSEVQDAFDAAKPTPETPEEIAEEEAREAQKTAYEEEFEDIYEKLEELGTVRMTRILSFRELDKKDAKKEGKDYNDGLTHEEWQIAEQLNNRLFGLNRVINGHEIDNLTIGHNKVDEQALVDRVKSFFPKNDPEDIERNREGLIVEFGERSRQTWSQLEELAYIESEQQLTPVQSLLVEHLKKKLKHEIKCQRLLESKKELSDDELIQFESAVDVRVASLFNVESDQETPKQHSDDSDTEDEKSSDKTEKEHSIIRNSDIKKPKTVISERPSNRGKREKGKFKETLKSRVSKAISKAKEVLEGVDEERMAEILKALKAGVNGGVDRQQSEKPKPENEEQLSKPEKQNSDSRRRAREILSVGVFAVTLLGLAANSALEDSEDIDEIEQTVEDTVEAIEAEN